MKIHHHLTPRRNRTPLALAIGFFDGFHRGHRALLESLQMFEAQGARLAALSFRQHPLVFLRPAAAPRLIVSVEERVNLLARSGVQELYLLDFNDQIASLTAEAFLEDVLLEQLQVIAVSVGMNFRFGAHRKGDIELARRVLTPQGVTFAAIEHIMDGGMPISSTRIRSALGQGRIAEVDVLLGRSYSISGPVVLGAGRGHDLGFPTANLAVPPEILLPPDGVYACSVVYQGVAFQGLVSIGTNPSFAGTARSVEVWIRNFSATIYGHQLTILQLRWIRAQERFESMTDLEAQMQADARVLDLS